MPVFRSTPPARWRRFASTSSAAISADPSISPRFLAKSDPRLFFFFNYEGTRASRPIGGNFVDLPHPDLFEGDLSRIYRNQSLNTTGGQPTGYQVGQIFAPGTVIRESNGRIIGGTPYPGNIIPKSEWSKNAVGFLNVMKFFNVAGAPGTPNQFRDRSLPLPAGVRL
jgi:hypothetical protein